MLASNLVLVRYNLNREVKLAKDARETGIGSALMQVFPGGTERPVAYASRVVTTT